MDYDTRIQVCTCENFTIVKGQTSSKEILNLGGILEKFYEKNPLLERKVKNVIDLIEYDKKIDRHLNQEFSFINSDNCSKIPNENSTSFFSLSFFPYGFSLSQNRSLYYYFKNIVYNIPPTYPFTEIKFKIRFQENVLDFDIEDDYLNNQDDCLKSAILDAFDFDYQSMNEILKKSDLTYELINKSSEIDFLKKPNGNFIII